VTELIKQINDAKTIGIKLDNEIASNDRREKAAEQYLRMKIGDE
jgi:hypothetical protein